MIIWINGPFGVGKTTTVAKLHASLPDATTYDPEVYGGVLQRTLGILRPGDFQDFSMWRTGTIRGAARRARRNATVLMAMSVLNLDYQLEILDGLRRRRLDVLHVTLHASSDVLRRRIEADTVDVGARPWRLEQLDRYEKAFHGLAERGSVVETDGLGPDEVAAKILALAGERS
ncbi:ATP/GTP-binding protein [Micromonospora sp. C95]|uniref:ATP/GTP-binding protein n=1 Tax=Micromonospora sp. C95 TaxID=2824882 RepID=UPI001B370771|nr:ATP/GTP-binding protein [Micromonospora sp. C95]MBQ1026063.1 ATP/GTP-binding protein [Micromonospora sp. C95]